MTATPRPPFPRAHAFPSDRELRGRRVVVLGLGLFGGGVAATRFLGRLDARILVTDLRDAEVLAPSLRRLADVRFEARLGEHRERDFRECDYVVVGPGVAPDAPLLDVAEAAGARLVSEVGLTVSRLRSPLAFVTGSKGKSTTTAILHAMVAAACATGRRPGRAWLGGNIGRPLLDSLGEIAAEDTVVFEVSSFQLEQLHGCPRAPEVAVVTNLFPVHLDRHGDFATYRRVKAEVLVGARRGVLNGDDPEVAGLPGSVGAAFPGTLAWFGGAARHDVRIEPGERVDRAGGARVDASDLRLLGDHNLRNVAAAWLAARGLGVDDEVAVAAARAFEGLPHRLERLPTAGAVRFVNDSIATTFRSVCAALEAVPGPIVLILGGKDQGAPVDELVPAIARRARAVVVMGESGPRLRVALSERLPDLPIVAVDDLSEAVSAARAHAAPGDAVLLSPGSPSFDRFRNFEDRGDRFRALAMATPGA